VATLEIYDEFDRRAMPVSLTGPEVTVGRASDNVVTIDGDDSVSRYHLLFKAVGAGWDVRDVGATNGTLLNGDRLTHEVILRNGDELQIGHTRLKYLNPQAASGTTTNKLETAPELTKRQHEVLVQLCLPRLDGNPFTPPMPTAEIAVKLYVGRPAVQMMLSELYRKFAIAEGRSRPAELANQAMYRRAVTMDDLREAKKRDEEEAKKRDGKGD
jgi:pSer/pThr/pTyr-binding forkhead associated (FHA) protein